MMKTQRKWTTLGAALACLALGGAAIAGGPNDDHGRRGGRGGGRDSQSQTQTRVKIRLQGVAVNGVKTEGSAEYRADARRATLHVEAEHVNLADGTRLQVTLNNAPIGMITLFEGEGELEVYGSPTIKSGDAVAVQTSVGGMTATILTGKF